MSRILTILLFVAVAFAQIPTVPVSGVWPNLPTLGGSIAAANAASPQTTPTYDSSGQVVHPSVKHFALNMPAPYNLASWNGWEYWMAMTPYPGAQGNYENPSVLVSHDGATWQVPPGGTNPIVPERGGGGSTYNHDGDMMLGPDGLMYLFYGWIVTNQTDYVGYKTSADGINWSAEVVLLSNPVSGPSYPASDWVSPTVIYKDGQWILWSIGYLSGVSRQITLLTSPTLAGLSTVTPVYCPISGIPEFVGITNVFPWHLEVQWYSDRYYMLLLTSTSVSSTSTMYLHFGESYDGIHWAVTAAPFINASASGWDNGFLYRSTMQYNVGAGNWDLWYTGKSSTNVWHVGYTSITGTP